MRYGASAIHAAAVEWAWQNALTGMSLPPSGSLFEMVEQHLEQASELETMLLPNIMLAMPTEVQALLRGKPESLRNAYRELLRSAVPQHDEAQQREIGNLAKPIWAERDQLSLHVSLWGRRFTALDRAGVIEWRQTFKQLAQGLHRMAELGGGEIAFAIRHWSMKNPGPHNAGRVAKMHALLERCID
eukprot:Selendium_serpulae@DN5920_c0_g1_i2.p1